MQYYAAPMEGITTYIYRQAHARWYGGIDKYFTPFIAGKKMTSREVRDILPENNTGLHLVPQILTNKASDFLSIAEQLASYGYDTVNLNLGCPSGTVTAKKRGAGFLSDPDALDAFLCEIYGKCPLKISIKTRLGISDLNDWSRLLHIYRKYPLQELIIHTRLLQEFYTGKTHPEAFWEAAKQLLSTGIPLCYNGDIVSEDSLADVLLQITASDTIIVGPGDSANPTASYVPDSIMIGRGLLRNPALAWQLRRFTASPPASSAGRRTGESCFEKDSVCSAETLRSFHDEILEGYRQIMSGDLPVLFKMKDLWTYMIDCFVKPGPVLSSASTDSGPADVSRHLKKIRKANRLSEYKIAVDNLFRM